MATLITCENAQKFCHKCATAKLLRQTGFARKIFGKLLLLGIERIRFVWSKFSVSFLLLAGVAYVRGGWYFVFVDSAENLLVFCTKPLMLMSPHGYPTSYFVISPSKEVYCNLCDLVLNDAVHCSNGHLFCKSCIEDELEKCHQCPTCQCLLQKSDLIVSNVNEKINTSVVKCVSESLSDDNCCKWTGKLVDLQAHLENECQFHAKKCPNNGCDKKFPFCRMKQHALECYKRSEECKYCKEVLPFDEIHIHEERCEHKEVVDSFSCQFNLCTTSCETQFNFENSCACM
jgi:hypothetical protein